MMGDAAVISRMHTLATAQKAKAQSMSMHLPARASHHVVAVFARCSMRWMKKRNATTAPIPRAMPPNTPNGTSQLNIS